MSTKKSEVVEVIESKVTKNEMVDLILFEEERAIQKELEDAQAVLEELEKDVPTLPEFIKKLEAIITPWVHKKVPLFFKAPFNTNYLVVSRSYSSRRNNKDPITFTLKNGNSLKTYTTIKSKFPVTIDGIETTGDTVFSMSINPEDFPMLLKYYKKVAAKAEKVQESRAAVTRITKELERVKSKGREIKAQITRTLLNGTEEGREMLKNLGKIKAKISRQNLLGN